MTVPVPESIRAGITRLNVNLNQETADALREIASSRGITVTETVRRAIGVYKFLDDEIQAGRIIQIATKKGKVRRELIIL